MLMPTVPMVNTTFRGATTPLEQPSSATETKSDERRRHRRQAIRVPVGLHRASGVIEHSVTVDVSPGGFSFSSCSFYQPGQRLTVDIACGATGQSIQAYARIVRRVEAYGSDERIYGVQYLDALV